MSARFESEILYDAAHRELLQTYADSMGWYVQPLERYVMFVGAARAEEHIVEDTQGAIAFFEGEGATPISFRIVRVVYDMALGIDEISDTEAGEVCPAGRHTKDPGYPCPECAKEP